jgi:hypothetical protein
MRKTFFKLLTLATMFASVVLISAQTGDDENMLKQIAEYRQWQRVNIQPIVLTSLDGIED